jgi:hypothetical protein
MELKFKKKTVSHIVKLINGLLAGCEVKLETTRTENFVITTAYLLSMADGTLPYQPPAYAVKTAISGKVGKKKLAELHTRAAQRFEKIAVHQH